MGTRWMSLVQRRKMTGRNRYKVDESSFKREMGES